MKVKYGSKERGNVTFKAQWRADTSGARLSRATEVSCEQLPRTAPLAALSVSLPAGLSGACSGPASSQISLSP